MSSAFKNLTDALVAAFAQAPALAEGRVWANRLRPLPQGQGSAIVVRLEQGQSREEVLGALDWQTRFAIECYGRGVSGSDPADAVDALLQAAWARLGAINATGLGAMALSVNPAIEWQFEEAETPMACAIVHLVVEHRTPVATLTPMS